MAEKAGPCFVQRRAASALAANYPGGALMARGVSERLPTALPSQFRRGVAWNVDRRCKAVREYAYDMIRLGNDLGGLDHLSEQQLWLVEEAAFWHGRLLANRAAVLSGRAATMTPGEHQNATNTLSGLLAKLGLERKARTVRSLRDVMTESTPAP